MNFHFGNVLAFAIGAIIMITGTARDAHALQCVRAAVGIGYAAQVDWYEYNTVVGDVNNVAGAFEVKSSTKPMIKSDRIALGQESCSDNATETRTAVIRVWGGNAADQAFKIIAAGVGAVVGAAICVVSAGSGCGAIVAAVAGGVGGAATGLPTIALPSPKEIFYVGAPSHYKKLNLLGSIYNPSYSEGDAAPALRGSPSGRDDRFPSVA